MKYHGSCNCKKVRFEVDLDLSKGTFKCNCTYCTKNRFWGASVKPEAFRLLSDEKDVAMSGINIERMFCPKCGVSIGGRGNQAGAGGKFIAISLASLDDLDPKDWAAAPVAYVDGRNDRWDKAPEFIAHL